MKISKAVIAAAGFGTRFLPITKTIQKEMLPVCSRPIIDYVVEDCVNAGIEEIIFIVSEHNKQLLHYYSENKRLLNYLNRMHKSHLYEPISKIHERVKFTFVKQADSEVYGTATPVQLAESYVKHEDAFVVCMGDDFIFNSDGSSEVERMINSFSSSRSEALATCIAKPDEFLSHYGVANTEKKHGFIFLKNFVEKPAPGLAPSNLVNISKYIFKPSIFDVIRDQQPDPKSGELFITDSITRVAEKHPVVIHEPQGRYMDGGNVLEWLKCNLIVAKSDPALANKLADFIKQEFPSF